MVQSWLTAIFGLRPFIGHHDWNGVFYSQIARNYLDYGYLFTKFGQMTSPGHFYTHYPPLFPFILSLNFRFFGVSDVSARLMTQLFYLAGIFLLYKICLLLKLKKSAALASGMVIFTPMFRYFSRMPSQEALIFFFTLLSLYFLLKKNHWGFYLSVVANGLTGWAGYFFYPLLFFYNRRLAIKANLILVVVFLFHLLHIYWLTGEFGGGGIFNALLLRLGLFPQLGLIEPELPGQFTWVSYMIKEARILTVYYTLILLILAGINFFFNRKKLTLILLAWGLSYPLIFSNVVFVHEYFNIYFLPFLGLSVANLVNRFKIKPWLIIIMALFIFWERNKFYQALITTNAFKPGYELGTLINQTVPQGETAVVANTKEFISSQNIFIEFYADRQIEYIELK